MQPATATGFQTVAGGWLCQSLECQDTKIDPERYLEYELLKEINKALFSGLLGIQLESWLWRCDDAADDDDDDDDDDNVMWKWW